MPAGYPVDGVDVSVVNECGEQLGPNEPGEVIVRSRFLSEGYWGHPELTQKKFLAAQNGGGERLYATGDIGQLMEDGCLELLGRKDFQIKIRGFRVDTAKVESAIAMYRDIAEVRVVGRSKHRRRRRSLRIL